MKRCPKCNRTYQDDNQKFCTVDGGRLESADSAEPKYDLGPTVITNQADLNLPPAAPPAPDLNKTMAAMPPPPTGEIRKGDTGPANNRTIITSFQPADFPSSQQQPPAPPPQQPPPDYQRQQPQQPPPPQQQHNYQQPPPQAYQPQQQYQQPQQQQYQPQPPAAQPSHTPQAAHAPSPSQPKAQAAAAGKGSRLPLIIGAVVLLLVAGAAAYYFLVLNKKADSTANANENANVANANNANANANTSANTNTNANANNTANANTKVEPPPFEPPPDTTQFVSSQSNLSGKIAEHFIPFSFYYPDSWELDSSVASGGTYFVRAERKLPPDFTQERLAVGWYESNGTYEADKSLFPTLVEATSARLSKLPGYEKVSEGPTKVNSMQAYEFSFKGLTKDTAKGDITFWGRIIFLPPGVDGRKTGLQLTILTSSLAPELEGIDDIGVKGQLPVVLESFRLK